MPVRMPTRPTANRTLPVQSIRLFRAHAVVAQLEQDHTVPKAPIGAETTNTRCHSIGARTAAEDQADERAADRGDAVDAQGQAALVLRERVGEDRRGVGEEERAADALPEPHEDDPQRGRRCRSSR